MCANLELPIDESAWHFCVLYFVNRCPGCSELAVEFGLVGVFCDHIQEESLRHARGREVERIANATIRSLQTKGHLSAGRMPELTDSGRNYLDSLTTPDLEGYRSLLDPMATSLTPNLDDLPGQRVAVFY